MTVSNTFDLLKLAVKFKGVYMPVMYSISYVKEFTVFGLLVPCMKDILERKEKSSWVRMAKFSHLVSSVLLLGSSYRGSFLH